MDVPAYLRRIGYTGDVRPSADVLAALHEAHLQTVPFENLSIGWKEPIVLDADRLFRKVVGARRGGFCYELNGLFAELLAALGFRVDKVAAGVAHETGGFGPMFDHMAMVVTLDERWLADVGFGDSFRRPIRLDERGVQTDGWRNFRIVDREDALVLEREEPDGAWRPQFLFTDEARSFDEYAPMCRYHQTSPESHFTTRVIASLATPDGRVTLSDRKLIETSADGGRRERELLDDGEVARVLGQVFGIERKEPTWVSA